MNPSIKAPIPADSMRLHLGQAPPIKIAVIDDQNFVIQILTVLLNSQPDMTVVGTAAQDMAAMAMLIAQQPDVVLVDMDASNILGTPMTQLVQQAGLKTAVVLLNCHPNSTLWPHIVQSGAKGFFCRGAHPDEFRAGIRLIHEGGVFMSEALMAHILEHKTSPGLGESSDPRPLTPAPLPGQLTLEPVQPPLLLPPQQSARWTITKVIAAALLLLIPAGLLGYLTLKVVQPAFEDPASKAYDSSLGYPAQQRAKGLPIDVNVVNVTEEQIDDSTSAQGEAVALQSIDVSSIHTGIVAAVKVAAGQRVTQGQTLVTLKRDHFQAQVVHAKRQIAIATDKLSVLKTNQADYAQTLQKQLINARRRLQFSQAQLAKLRSLEAEGVIAKNQLLEQQDIIAQRQADVVEAEQAVSLAEKNYQTELKDNQLIIADNQKVLQQAQRNVQQTLVTSPHTGLISRLSVNPGELVNPEQSLLTLSRQMAFKVDVDQTQINKIKVGDAVQVRLVAFSGQTFSGQVIRINPTVATGDRVQSQAEQQTQYSYPVWVSAKGVNLTPGLQGIAEFKRTLTRRMVPESSVNHFSAGEGLLMVAENNQAAVKRVKLGKVYGTQREILEGIPLGTPVLVNPQGIEVGDRLNPLLKPLPGAAQS